MQKQKRVKDGIIAMGLVPKSQQTDEFGGYQKQWQDQKIDEFGLESISNLLNIDIEKKAQEIISKESPLQKRQIAKPVHQIQLSGQKEKSEGERVIEKKSSESHETSKNSSNEVKCYEKLKQDTTDDGMEEIKEKYKANM